MNLTKQNISQIIKLNFSWVKDLRKKVFIMDNGYKPLSKAFVLNTIKDDEWLKTDKSYKPEVFDCDDFVMYLKCKVSKIFVQDQQQLPGAIGFIITSGHAFSLSIDSKRKITIYDTVRTKLETDPEKFASFLEINPGNIVKLIYI